jgi:drug/metabolite transporter (DMT)-like permease
MCKNSSSHNSEASPLLPTTNNNITANDTTAAGLKRNGRFLLLLVAFLYGSLSVALRAVYARPGPPEPSILSATRGWMSVLCLVPVVVMPAKNKSSSSTTTTTASSSSLVFYLFALELAVFNVGTQGLLNVGLVTTASARSAFFTQLSVVITPLLTFGIGFVKGQRKVVGRRVWMACFVALLGLYILSSDGDDDNSSQQQADNNSNHLILSFGDWCCLGSAFCWSYYIYRLSDWGDRFDETQTMLAKNIFMAVLYSLWTVVSYFTSPTCVADAESFCLWEAWRDPIALAILFYSAASSGAFCDVLQQTAQSHVPAAESNVLLSLEPVFSALLGWILLSELPSLKEWIGGACIVGASLVASIA